MNAGALQHVVHHLKQNGAVFANLLQLAARLGPAGPDGLAQELGESQNGSKWRAQLVANDGKEIGLVLVVSGELGIVLLHSTTLTLQLGISAGELLGALGHLRLQTSVKLLQALGHGMVLLDEVVYLAGRVQHASVGRGQGTSRRQAT